MYASESSLEDLLKRNDVRKLGESCEELQRFISFEISVANQQNAGARHRFYGMFLLILERIFGADDAAAAAYASGWLASAARPDLHGGPRLPLRVGGTAAKGVGASELLMQLVATLSRDGNALYRLLDPYPQKDGGSLFTVVQQRNHPVQFTLSCTTLPGRTQFLLAGNGTYNRVRTANAQLYLRCLAIPPAGQTQLHTPRHPALILHMLEYFFFSFCRWPTVTRVKAGGKAAYGAKAPRSYAGGLLSSSPYHTLVVAYVRFLLPHAARVHPATGGAENRRLSPDAELFLRIAIEWWLEANSAEVSRTQRGHTLQDAMSTPPVQRRGLPLKAAEELEMFPLGDFVQPTEACLQAIYALVLHCLADPELERLSHFGSLHAHLAPGATVRLSQAMEMLQQPLFVFISLFLQHASTHAASATAFSLVLDIWLLVLQPWRAPGLLGDAPATASGYTPEWRFYVIASYHFYAELPCSLMRRSRDFDLTNPRDAQRHLEALHKVFAVYTPPLQDCLAYASGLRSSVHPDPWAASDLAGLQHHCDRLEQFCPSTPAAPERCRADAEQLLLELHVSSLLAANSPGKPQANLESWMNSLFGAASPPPQAALPPGHARATVWLRDTEPVLRQIFHIPDSFRPEETGLSRVGRLAGPGRSVTEPAPETVEGKADLGPLLLSDAGRDQVMHGWRRCRPADVRFAGDALSSPICSYEIGVLVILTVRLSKALNRWLELPRPEDKEPRWVRDLPGFLRRPLSSFRFNLRFLADYRNLLFALVVYIAYRVLAVLIAFAMAPGPPRQPRAPRPPRRTRPRQAASRRPVPEF